MSVPAIVRYRGLLLALLALCVILDVLTIAVVSAMGGWIHIALLVVVLFATLLAYNVVKDFRP